MSREILRFARERNVTRLVIGRPRWRNGIVQRFMGVLREPVSETLLDGATDFEVTVVAPHAKFERRKALLGRSLIPTDWRGPVAAILVSGVVTLLAWPITQVDAIPSGAITVLYLLGVMLVAYRFGLTPSLLASGLGFLGYNFFYTEPYLTLSVTKSSDIVSLSVFLIGALFTGTLASRLKAQVETMRAAQARTETLYDFARKIASAPRPMTCSGRGRACRPRPSGDVLILTPGAQGELRQVQAGRPSTRNSIRAISGPPNGPSRRLKRRALARAPCPMPPGNSCRSRRRDGLSARWACVSMIRPARKTLKPNACCLLFEDQVAVAVERSRLSDEVANARITAESDRLRAALLNAVSHDLRTPLVTVIGATSSLSEEASGLTAEARQMLAASAHEEARRLDRTVQNLLDMTRRPWCLEAEPRGN